ncbi:MAG TPA: hypothetical protein VFI05_07145 [Nitrospiraceae bacterium]|nr:hypothetical protein [Nitrospiraceae bacterium]
MPDLRRIFIGGGPPALLAILVACSELTSPITTVPTASPPADSSSGPFFQVDANEAKMYRALAREQDLHLTTCAQERTCEQAHFSRALLALFENQRTAAKHFQDVIAGAPKSRLALASNDWLILLQEVSPENERHAHLVRATQSVILELLNREQAIKEELSARERKLKDLSAQLESLKLIDQEMNEKAHRLRPRTRTLQGISEPTDTPR